ncbi:MAG: hypothetical protein J3R72DRAFT_444324 [Linnemannia gamsii]|nr:MAG: hypothetical protein J3R72DRAFT_444324 [Linnemannia gamsii]
MMYTRGAFNNWRGRGRSEEETPPGNGQGQGWDRNRGRGTGQSVRGGYNASQGRRSFDDQRDGSSSWGRGRGSRGRGGFDTPQDGTSGWNDSPRSRRSWGFSSPQDETSSSSSGCRGGSRGGYHALRGGFNGGGAGANSEESGWEGFSNQERADIMRTCRSTVQILKEGTDDLIVPSTAGVSFTLAQDVLEKGNLDALRTSSQIELFLQSSLINLSNHHSVDTSWVFCSLASEKGIAQLRHIMMQPVSIDVSDDASIVSFQNVILPLVGLFTRQNVCQSALTSESNVIYGLVHELSQPFLGTSVLSNMRSLLDQSSVHDFSRVSPTQPSSSYRHQHRQHQRGTLGGDLPLRCALLAIVRLFYQVLTRFPNSAAGLCQLVDELVALVDQCLQRSEGENAMKIRLEFALRTEAKRLSEIIHGMIPNRGVSLQQTSQAKPSTSRALMSGPGELVFQGPRHDNDHTMIGKIALLPTRDEVLCRDDPYLSINNDKESLTHFLPSGWPRHLDDHFRLYRQDMFGLLRTGIQAFVDLLEKTDRHSDQDFVDPEKFSSLVGDDISLNVYSNVQFLKISTENYYPGLTEISFDQPLKIQGLEQQDRQEFWKKAQGRLMHGSLVFLARRSRAQAGGDYRGHQVALALVRDREISDLSESEKVAYVKVFFTDPASYSTAFAPLQSSSANSERWFMIECPGSHYESYRSVLKALQTKLPSTLPFGKYIAPSEEDTADSLYSSGEIVIDPPFYATTPGFKFDLSVLLENGATCDLNVRGKLSADRALTVLREHSSLDDTQASALVETLGRELALISGPPGTGKTRIGVDLMRVLLHNKQATNSGPILVICYTNHALDQFLENLLDAGYTRFARLGSQSKSQRLQNYNLNEIMAKRPRSKPHAVRRVIAKAFLTSDRAVKAIRNLTWEIRTSHFSWRHVKEYLEFENPEQCGQLEDGPHAPKVWEDDESEFTPTSHSTGKHAYARWITGKDLEERRDRSWHANVQDRAGVLPTNATSTLGQGPVGVHIERNETAVLDRPLSLLGGDVWSMSLVERHRLVEYWSPGIIRLIEEELEQHHRDLKTSNEHKFSAFDEQRRLLLSSMDFIGMTTNSSAKYQTLLESVAAKIIVCEEANEVLELSILATLSPCTQQLILIGDHLQLRPYLQTLNNSSSDSMVGKKYNLGRSLFERLVTSEDNQLPVSHLTIQRRMRPEISNLIKNTLYPTLEDDSSVSQYPDVVGMGSNLFFMSHGHSEDNDKFGPQSFSNNFEVEMVEALALHFIRNGYSQPGDIVVLTPYLGQLIKLRDHLQKRFVVNVDGRDQDWMDALGSERVPKASQGTQSERIAERIEETPQNHIAIRTIDGIQGEEAKIVIISLVRSDVTPGDETMRSSLGFLRSLNRINVLLTRAQHGMFLIGNAGVMAQPEHGVWPAIMNELERLGRVGLGFPVVCKGHPKSRRIVCSPEDLEAVEVDETEKHMKAALALSQGAKRQDDKAKFSIFDGRKEW